MSNDNLPTFASGGADLVTAGAVPSHQQILVRPEGESVPGGDDELGSQLYRVVRQALRGRWVLAVVLGVALGSILGSVAWLMNKPLYRSDALIRISYEIPRVQLQPEMRPMDAFEAYMQSQAALISSATVVDKALHDPIWEQRGFHNMGRANVDGFVSQLTVEHRQGTEHLKVSYSAEDANFASTAVRAVVHAYVSNYNQTDRQSTQEKITALKDQRSQLERHISDQQAALQNQFASVGGASVDRLYDSAVQSLTRVESALVDVRIAKALLESIKQNGGVVKYTPQQIGRMDPTMGRYMQQRQDAEERLEQLRLRGYGEQHPQVVETQAELNMINAKIIKYAREFKPDPSAAIVPAPGPVGQSQGLVGRTVEELNGQEQNLVVLTQKAKDYMVELGQKKLGIEGIQGEINKSRIELADISAKLSTLQIDATLSGRLSVLSDGEVPLTPARDRRPQYATAGALAGLVLPAAFMVMLYTARRRYRYSTDAADDLAARIPLLGILPQLPARLTDPESAADAAQCVHQIRVMLQVQSKSTGPMIYHVTSACPGEGKTSLVASLALSYAAAGQNTLVVDADLIGQRLTHGYGLEDKPGFREALSRSGKDPVGIHSSGVPNLSVLPAGISDGRDACAISSGSVKKLLAVLRKQFDVILIDSGPILGSLEALVVAQVSDGVILTISREQQKPLVDRAMRQLKSVGAQIAGMVFNKAERSDFRRSVGVTSLRSIPRTGDGSLVKAGVTSTSGFGSLVDSVQTYLPAGE